VATAPTADDLAAIAGVADEIELRPKTAFEASTHGMQWQQENQIYILVI
jgi:hypothetical protein